MKAGISYSVPVCIISIFILFIAPTMIGFGSAFKTFPGNSSPYGLTYGQWTAKWWNWLVSFPDNQENKSLTQNPGQDTSGKSCTLGQTGPVWFLAGSTGKLGPHIVRTCTIPAGKAILFPVVNYECSNLENPGSDLKECAVAHENDVRDAQATVDGVPLTSSQIQRVQSPLYNLVLPAKNIFGVQVNPNVKSVSTQSVSDGFWVFLPPLTPGSHNIVFKAGYQGSYLNTSSNPVSEDVTYHLTVR